MTRTWLIILAVTASLVIAAVAAGCSSSDTSDTSNTSGTATSASGSSTTVASATTDTTDSTTIVQGGKSLDDYKAEIPDLEKAVAADPTDLTSWEKLAVAHYQLHEYDEAAAAYLEILAVVDDAFTHNNLGNVYRDQEKYDEAIAQYEKAIELDPTLKQPYINLAGVYRDQGNTDKAVEILQQAQKALNTEDAKTAKDYETQITSTTTT